MEELRLRRYVRILFAAAFVVFVFNKLILRPAFESWTLPDALMVFTYSVPNFCEAIMGLTVVSGLLLWSRQRGFGPLQSVGRRACLVLATVLAGTYVLTQEFGLHRLGGNNVFDPNDVVASLLGLTLTAGLFFKYGVLQDSATSHTRADSADT